MHDEEMSAKYVAHTRVVVEVLERATNILQCQAKEDAAELMTLFITQAAHIVSSLVGHERACEFLNGLSADLPDCQGATVVSWESTDPTPTTKH